MVPDVALARTFYGDVMGWTFAESDPDFDYTVAEADAHAAAVITANGGTVMMGPTDVGQHGRMCMAIDPAGAVFGVWQAREMIGAEIVNEPGGITWEDLRSTDPWGAGFWVVQLPEGVEAHDRSDWREDAASVKPPGVACRPWRGSPRWCW